MTDRALNLLEGGEIVACELTDDGQTLLLDVRHYPLGTSRVTITAKDGTLRLDEDEPPGAGQDPYGRPDPRTHPEAWCE